MFITILQSAIISAIFIFLIHYLVKFFKNTLTTPKIKDFVSLPAQKYKKMFDTMDGLDVDESAISVKTLTQPDTKEDMKSELKNFMKNHLTPRDKTIEEVIEWDSGDFAPLSSTFSNY